jgi:hypothetical protein
MSAPNYLAELRAWLDDTALRFRSARLFQPLARVAVARDIAADAAKESNAIAQAAHSASTHDREALRILDDVLADGRVEDSEIPALRRARALVHRSAETDHDIAERAHVPA